MFQKESRILGCKAIARWSACTALIVGFLAVGQVDADLITITGANNLVRVFNAPTSLDQQDADSNASSGFLGVVNGQYKSEQTRTHDPNAKIEASYSHEFPSSAVGDVNFFNAFGSSEVFFTTNQYVDYVSFGGSSHYFWDGAYSNSESKWSLFNLTTNTLLYERTVGKANNSDYGNDTGSVAGTLAPNHQFRFYSQFRSSNNGLISPSAIAPTGFGAVSFSASSVPEPASIGFSALAAIGLATCRRRRRVN